MPGPGGRPARTGRDGYPELAELASWFKKAIQERGYPSVHAFVKEHTLDKNRVYDLVAGRQPLTLESARNLSRLLKRDPAEVEAIWQRAKEATDRRLMSAEDEERPRVTSWADIPRPELALRHVLDALTEAVEQLPYRLLGVEPPSLSTVYVRQRLRRDGGATAGADSAKERQDTRPERPEAATSGSDAAMTVTEALNRSEHLLVTGEPGAGKSTLGHHLVSRLARIWMRRESATDAPLTEPVVPIRVSARALIGEGAWSTVLAEAARRALGPYLVTEPSPQLFSRRAQGARWLIVVDGLDEILDQPTRAGIIRTLGRHARAGGDYRFVITTRPLPDAELGPLRGAHIGTCHIEPFEPEELRLFAERWFTAQDPITAERRAAQFLDQVEDARLKDLVRNPLLATIAAVASTREPDRPLPTNRVDLYERFYEYLVTDEQASGRATPNELRRLREGQPSRYRLAEWVYGQRAALIDAMASSRMTSETPINEVGHAWVKEHRPDDVKLSPGWEQDFDRLLIDTGVFVYEASGLRFLHHTFAEFLAARSFAQNIPADFPELDAWIARGLKVAQRNYVLLTFVVWGRRQGNDAGLVLRRLLEGGRERVLLAGELLAESQSVGDGEGRAVVDRLIDLALGNARQENDEYDLPPFSPYRPVRAEHRLAAASRAFDVLEGIAGHAYTTEQLRRVIRWPELPMETRLLAADALSSVAGREQALAEVTTLSDAVATPLTRFALAVLLRDGETETSARARSLLLAVGRDPQADPEVKSAAAEELAEIGETAAAVEAAKEVIAHPHAVGNDFRRAIEVLNGEPSGRTFLDTELLSDSLSRHPQDKAQLAVELRRVGLDEQAWTLVDDALNDEMGDAQVSGNTMSEAVLRAWLSAASEDAVEALLLRLGEGSTLDADGRATLAGELARAGHPTQAARFAGDVLADPRAREGNVIWAISTWLSAAGEGAVDKLLTIMDDRPSLGAWTRSKLAEELAKAGRVEKAVSLARHVLVDPTADSIDMTTAAEVCRQAGVVEDEILSSIEGRRTDTPEARTDSISALASLGFHEAATERTLQLLVDPPESPRVLSSLLTDFLAASGPAGAERILTSIEAHPLSALHRFTVAGALATQGALSAAATLWCGLLTDTTSRPSESVTVLTNLLDTGHRERAIETLRTALAAPDLRLPERTRLRSLLAWAELSDTGDEAGATD